MITSVREAISTAVIAEFSKANAVSNVMRQTFLPSMAAATSTSTQDDSQPPNDIENALYGQLSSKIATVDGVQKLETDLGDRKIVSCYVRNILLIHNRSLHIYNKI